MHKYESKSELLNAIRTTLLPYVMIGFERGAPVSFYRLDVERASGVFCCIGIICEQSLEQPSYAYVENAEICVISNDDVVSFVDLKTVKIRRQRLLTGFIFKVYVSPKNDGIVVVHQVGVAKYSYHGEVIWNVNTDMIVNYSYSESEQAIKILEDESRFERQIDMNSGDISTCC